MTQGRLHLLQRALKKKGVPSSSEETTFLYLTPRQNESPAKNEQLAVFLHFLREYIPTILCYQTLLFALFCRINVTGSLCILILEKMHFQEKIRGFPLPFVDEKQKMWHRIILEKASS